MSTTKTSAQVPKLRFPGFKEHPSAITLLEVCNGEISNGVFNDPGKRDGSYRLVNVLNMFGTDQIDVSSLSALALERKEFEKNKVKYGDIFFTRSSLVPAGIAWSNVFLSREDNVTYDGHLMKISPDLDKFSPAYLAQYFRSRPIRKQLIVRGKTGTMTTIGQGDIATVELNVPRLPEQQKIAAFLTAVDGRIEQLSRKKALLEAYKKGVMQQLFTQTLRFQDDHGHDFPDWEDKTLGDVVNLLSGQHLGPDDYNENGEGVPYFTGPSDFTSEPSSFTKWTTKNSKIAGPDSVLITVEGNGVGRVMYSTLDQVALGRQLMALRSSSCNNRYLYQYLLTKAQEFVALGSGNLIPGLSRGDILTMALPCPSLPEQTKIAGFLSALDGKIAAVGEQMMQMQAWKKGLLQQMFV